MITDDESDTSTYSLHCFHRKLKTEPLAGALDLCRARMRKWYIVGVTNTEGEEREPSNPQAYNKLFTF